MWSEGGPWMSDEARADLVWFSFVDVERCTKDYEKWGTA